MYAPMIGISGAIHLAAKRPWMTMVAAGTVMTLWLALAVRDPGPPSTPAPPVPAIAFMKSGNSF
jgi:hypothetical protein